MNDLALKQKRARGYSKHGLTTLKRGVNALGNQAIDQRTTLGKSLAKWWADLVSDVGGLDNISAQQSALIDLAVRSKLSLDSIDAWLLTQRTLIKKRKNH